MKGILKGFFGIAILCFLGIVYWSSVLVEADLKAVRADLKELKRETENLLYQLRRDQNKEHTFEKTQTQSRIDPQYENLLVEDLFYSKTLPQILGNQFFPHGTRKEAILGRPENLHPFNQFRDVSTMHQMCTVHVAQMHVGIYETMCGDMAVKLEARPRPDIPTAPEFWVHLRKDVFWEPLKNEHFPAELKLAPHFFERHLVTAYDFKFFYDSIMNPYVSDPKAVSLRSYYEDIEEFKVIDPYTFVVKWKAIPVKDEKGEQVLRIKYMAKELTGSLQPLPCFVFQYFSDGNKIIDDDEDSDTYRKNSVWAQNFTNHWAKNTIVSCGAWLFNGATDETIKFKRNPTFYNPNAALVDELHYVYKESLDAIWQDFKAGKIDICRLAPNQFAELQQFLNSREYQHQKSPIHQLDYVESSYYYLGWNQSSPFFNTQIVRQAMTMAIDRNRIIEQNLNHMGITITGPLFPFSDSYDHSISPWPYNPELARRLLDEAGWYDSDGDGVRDKLIGNHVTPFRFRLFYFIKSFSSKIIAEYIATALKEIGVDCQLAGMDITDLSHQFDDKSFDAILLGWKLGTPPDDPRQLWHSSGAKEKGSSNAICFINPEVDSIIDQLNYEYDKSKRDHLYHRFHQIIHQEAPYTFLYAPRVRLLYRDQIQNVFIPKDRQDLIPGANQAEPNMSIVWLK